MLSFDLIDSVLEIGDSDVSNGLFEVRFDDFYKRQFGDSGSKLNSARLIYMFYGAILSLPLTPKMTEHGIDGLLISKKGESLDLIVSYATPDESLSLKLIRFDANVPPTKVPTEQCLIQDAQRLLSSVKERPINSDELKLALNEIHNVIFEYESDQLPVTLRPKIAKTPYNIKHSSTVSNTEVSGLKLLLQSQYAESASLFVKQLQSDVHDVVKYNSHAFTRLLVMHHQMLARSMQLSTKVNDMYLFMIGALEMNWARLYHLSVHTIFEPHKSIIRSLVINYNVPKKIWKPRPVSFIIQLLESPLQMSHKNYVDNMYHNMAKNVPNIESKAIVIGIEHKKLVDPSTIMDMATFEKLPFTFLLDLNPMENLVDLLLKPFDRTTLFRLDYCINKLNEIGKYGLHAYLYGQLMSYSKYETEKYLYQGSGVGEGITKFAFKIRGSENGVLVDIYQASSYIPRPTYDRLVPVRDLNVKRLLRISVHQAYNKVNADKFQVHMVRSDAEFLDQADIQGQEEVISDTTWWPIFNVDPNLIIAEIEAHGETFEELPDSDRLHVILDSIDRKMLRLQNSMSFLDIIHFMSGLFSDWNKIFYHGFLGILKNDGTPLFLSSLYTVTGDEEDHARQTLKEISGKYVRFDYFPNPLRRIANFVCITRTSENGNRFGISRLSTFEENKSAFESCLPHNMVRMKRKSLVTIPCIADEIPDHTNEALGDDEKLTSLSESDKLKSENPIRSLKTIKMKISPHLEIVDKVSKVIMTAQIFKDMVGALIRGDYKTFAVNTAFLASGPLLECLSMKMIAKGVSLGDSLLGRSLLISAPFMGRLPIMGFVGFDLYEQVKSYKNGNKGAMVNIVGDSAILTIDFATASVEGAEALGVVSGVADVAGPVGFAIGTAIFVGVDIYNSVKAVSSIDAMVQLTGWQKFTTGFFSFLHVSPTKTVQKELFEKNAADASIENAANFFKNHPSVKYYLFPSYQDNGEFVENNIIDLRTNVTRMAHSWPKDIANTKLICAGNNYSELRINNGTVSINAVSQDTLVKIYEKYLLLSKKLNAVVNIFSMQENISMLFGSGKAIHHRNSNNHDNHINILPNDPNRETFLVGGENQNVFRISGPHFHSTNAYSLTTMPTVTIMNYADNNFVNVIDLYEIILFIYDKFSGQITVRMKTRGSDMLMRVYAQRPDGAIMNLINITIDKALENENYKRIVVNMRRPMTITVAENATFLVPADYKLPNETYSVLHSGLVEPYTTVVSPRLLGKYDITVYDSTNLVLTNLMHVDDVKDLVFIILKDFFFSDELQTLRLKFFDQVVELDLFKEVRIGYRNFEDIFDDEKDT
uniref:VP4 n=1 Tax=Romanomermis culicivorax TaxID=13658 RepID=A0A915HF59_ROMCU